MECRFTVGQKVVCVQRIPLVIRLAVCPSMEWPQVGEVYTVRQLTPDPLGIYAALVLLNEVRNSPCTCKGKTQEGGFPHVMFKPLEHSGMSILREIAESPKPIPGEHIPAPREVEKV